MNNRTVNNRVNVLPELGGSQSVQETQTRQVNQALNTALTRTLPPFPALNVRNLDLLVAPPSTYSISTEDRTLTMVGTLAAAKVQFPQAKLNAGRQLHLIFRNTPDAPSLTAAATGGTITAGVYFVVTTFLLTGGGETLPSLPSLIQTMTATSTVTTRSPGGPTLSGVSGYQVYVGATNTGPFYLQTGSGIAIGTDSAFATPFATSGSVPPTSNPSAALPALIPWPGDHLESLPTGATSALYQSDGQTTWHLASTSADASASAGVTSLNALIDAILLAATNNCVLSVSGNTITIDGRVGPRFGYQWPANGANITLQDSDYAIYGTSGQNVNNVTFPLAADYPGKVVRFTYPPGGNLIASGSDTIDGYAGQTAEYQSDGVSKWVRTWHV